MLPANAILTAEGIIPDDGRLPRITFETPDEATLIVGEETWDWNPVPTIRTRQSDPNTAEIESQEAVESDGVDDGLDTIENSKYTQSGVGSGLNHFLSESAVEAHLNGLA